MCINSNNNTKPNIYFTETTTPKVYFTETTTPNIYFTETATSVKCHKTNWSIVQDCVILLKVVCLVFFFNCICRSHGPVRPPHPSTTCHPPRRWYICRLAAGLCRTVAPPSGYDDPTHRPSLLDARGRQIRAFGARVRHSRPSRLRVCARVSCWRTRASLMRRPKWCDRGASVIAASIRNDHWPKGAYLLNYWPHFFFF